MKECKYDLGHNEFYLMNYFTMGFSPDEDEDMTIDEYVERLKKESPLIWNEAHSGYESIRKIGKRMTMIAKSMKSHVIGCEKCRARYKDFVESQRKDDRRLSGLFELAGLKIDVDFIDSIDPDFLGLYSH